MLDWGLSLQSARRQRRWHRIRRGGLGVVHSDTGVVDVVVLDVAFATI